MTLKINKAVLVSLILLIVLIIGYFSFFKKEIDNKGEIKKEIIIIDSKNDSTTATSTPVPTSTSTLNNNTYLYKNHGFTIELPKGYIPEEIKSEGGPSISINLANDDYIAYVTDNEFWDKYYISEYTYIKDVKIGEDTFKEYKIPNRDINILWFSKGKIGYELRGDIKKFATFKFTGWNN